MGNSAGAEHTLQQAAEDMPENMDAAQLLKDYLVQTGHGDRAEQVYAGLVSKYPKSIPFKVVYARVLMQRNNYAKAQTVVDDLSKVSSNSPDVQLLNGALLLHAGKKDEAVALLQKAAKNAPDSVPVQLLLAQSAKAKGDLSLSEASFREAARLDPSSLEAQSGLASIASSRGDSSLLAQVADSTINLHPDYASAYLWRGTAEANQKQYDQAEVDFQTALKKDPNNAIAYTELGQLRLRQQKVPEGKALLEQALVKDPNDVSALHLLIAYDLAAKQPEKALARIQGQIARASGNANLYNDLAVLQLGMKDPASARDNAKKGMQLDPSNQTLLQTFAQAEAALGETDQAIAAWQQWSNTHPDDASAFVMLGTFEEAKGDAAKAMELYKKAIQLSPGQPVASNNLAYLMVESGDSMDVALSLAQTARRAMPESPSTADTLAWVYYHKGTFASARDLLEDALKIDPTNASIQYHLGLTYGKLNDKPNAAAHLKKASLLSPNTQTAKDAADALARLG
jgi:tetratricopeptide (TPR) repeat protein